MVQSGSDEDEGMVYLSEVRLVIYTTRGLPRLNGARMKLQQFCTFWYEMTFATWRRCFNTFLVARGFSSRIEGRARGDAC